MRKSIKISYFFIFIFTISCIQVSLNNSAALPVVKKNDLISLGYRLTVSAVQVEVFTEEAPFKGQVAIDVIKPIGLYNEIIGMKLGEVRNLIVAKEDGFSEYDPKYGIYANLTLYYDDLTIFEINGVHITEIENGGLTPGSFGFYFLRVVLGLLGATAFIFLIYGGYKFYPRIFGKRCTVCKTLAVGTCRKCGRVFCERCYSNGCPYCKSRTMIRFKT
ncbi:MAG: hypothetical protein HGN29_11520 [Asgard group archaeon]|nr:hypothetical protein [Asgard group archaeon]